MASNVKRERRVRLEKVLEAEFERWSDKSPEQLIAELADLQNYCVESDGNEYQFEVQILENTDDYIFVAISVDDGRLPYSIHPIGKSVKKNKR